MNVKITKSRICGNVLIPPSKSVAHRKMICCALSGGRLKCVGGKDMQATSRCLEIMSPFIDDFLNGRSDIKCDRHVTLNVGESGSTLRFLLPIVCALGMNATFEAEGRLAQRPLEGLINTLESRGAVFKRAGEFELPLSVLGKIESGEYVVDGSVSSQYITGLLFALPLLRGDSRIKIVGNAVSKNYIEITLGVLKDFGIQIECVFDGYFVKGNQRYVMPNDLSVEGDWSSAGFMLAAGVLAGETRLWGLNSNSLQGDKITVDFLKEMGADISFEDGVYVVKKSTLKAIDFDAQNCPDAVPIMATVMSFANGVSHMKHVDRLRDKESDRLSAVREMLLNFGIKTEYDNDVLTVFGGKHTACVADSFNDHRMAMSAAVCALATEGESVICGMECMDKSYPDFIKVIKSMGANVVRLN